MLRALARDLPRSLRWLGRGLLLLCLGDPSLVDAQLPPRLPRAPLLEVAREQVGAREASERYEVTGRGATLCLVDTGIDRLRVPAETPYLFVPGAPPRGDALESRFEGAVYRDRRQFPADTHGHGTAMASIALGLAPDAALIVVAAYDGALGGFSDDAILAGVRFCRAVAAEDPELDARRLVVLLSLGGHDGAHDGRGAFERALEAEATTPIVVAAGNDGGRAVHAEGRALEGELTRVAVFVPEPAREDAEVALAVRFERGGPEASFSIALDGGAESGPLSTTEAREMTLGPASLTAEPRGPDAVVLHLRGLGIGGAHTLWVRGPAAFDVWLAEARLGRTFLPPSLGGPHTSASAQITIPATAPALIAVGASVSRSHPDAGEGRPRDVGERAELSSLGPSADGAPKPDLLAPGQWLVATRSSQLVAGDPNNVLGGLPPPESLPLDRLAVRGTSASAALVAGALLLALELDPTLGPRAREALVATAGDEVWSAERGWGELDVGALLDFVAGRSAPRPLVVTATRPLVPTDANVWFTGRAAGSRLELVRGAARVGGDLRGGSAQLSLPAPADARVGDTLRYAVWLDDAERASVPVTVRLERGARGEVRPGGGAGCAVLAPGARTNVGALPALALLSLRRPRPRPRRGRRRGRRARRGSARSCAPARR